MLLSLANLCKCNFTNASLSWEKLPWIVFGSFYQIFSCHQLFIVCWGKSFCFQNCTQLQLIPKFVWSIYIKKLWHQVQLLRITVLWFADFSFWVDLLFLKLWYHSNKSSLPTNVDVASTIQYVPNILLILCHLIGNIDLLLLKT